jgi:hypothetical protein
MFVSGSAATTQCQGTVGTVLFFCRVSGSEEVEARDDLIAFGVVENEDDAEHVLS